ncbi:MAG: crotonase [Deltaproteobacteria bacterium]|nr:MAG: crotonase [Deltaproteobacteria bacterium]
MSYKTVLVEKEGAVAFVTVNRPEALNAINGDVIDDLTSAITELNGDDAVRVIVITGAGEKSFVAGADIKHMSTLSPVEVFEFVRKGQELTFLMEKSPKVIIAMVNGYALGGGCELAMACDLIIASDRAIFGQPEVNLGIIPGMGGTQRLPRLVGRNLAKELVLTGDHISAQRAYEMGLVNRVVPHDQLREETLKIANKIASKAPFAIYTAKRSINQGLNCSLEDGCYLELTNFALGFSTEDSREGMKAFIEKRKPEFKGK